MSRVITLLAIASGLAHWHWQHAIAGKPRWRSWVGLRLLLIAKYDAADSRELWTSYSNSKAVQRGCCF